MKSLRTAAAVLVLPAVLSVSQATAAPPSVTASQLAANAGTVSVGAARAAVQAAERVRREMREDGAHDAKVRGCWRAGRSVGCTGVVGGQDGAVKWRCVLEIRIRRHGARHRAKVADAVCTAELA
jgi:pyruvate/2-oxoglutarate dehydrogenase complex dihydrolipoamide acyltransferase (E2) component